MQEILLLLGIDMQTLSSVKYQRIRVGSDRKFYKIQKWLTTNFTRETSDAKQKIAGKFQQNLPVTRSADERLFFLRVVSRYADYPGVTSYFLNILIVYTVYRVNEKRERVEKNQIRKSFEPRNH